MTISLHHFLLLRKAWVPLPGLGEGFIPRSVWLEIDLKTVEGMKPRFVKIFSYTKKIGTIALFIILCNFDLVKLKLVVHVVMDWEAKEIGKKGTWSTDLIAKLLLIFD